MRDLPADGAIPPRVVIEHVQPEVDGGRFAVKRVEGDLVRVEADIFADGHDELDARLFYRKAGEPHWHETAMTLINNDHWFGEFTVEELGEYVYRLTGWVDHFATWRRDFRKWLEVRQDIESELLVAAGLVRNAAANASGQDARLLAERAAALAAATDVDTRAELALDDSLADLMVTYGDHGTITEYDRGQRIFVDRERARFGTWYEMFPRSTSPDESRQGTFRDCIARLPYVSDMGFDVVYFPPIHPIGETNRKGRNNSPISQPGEPGSPWGIGSAAGGHKAIDPKLGTLEDFRALVAAAQDRGMEVALDIAFQCSPDHPYVKEQPQWFRHRPDGSLRYAENPPKKYEDIYPINFETEDWQALWQELTSVILFWAEQGVQIFRVDNPHTKSFAFWEYAIAAVKAQHPGAIFLAEAFTRPRIMYQLAKLGFTQSYTYFTWRNDPREMNEYLTELTTTEVKEYFRPNFWPNTPDILHEVLQTGGRPTFLMRYVLAATLTANIGIYGPAYELIVNEPREPGSEEYLHSEKYEVKHWDLDAPDSLATFIGLVNRIRRDNPALQWNETLRFLDNSNGMILAYTKTSRDGSNVVLAVVNMDLFNRQEVSFRLPLAELGLPTDNPYEVEDLLHQTRFTWSGEWQTVSLDPAELPALIFKLNP